MFPLRQESCCTKSAAKKETLPAISRKGAFPCITAFFNTVTLRSFPLENFLLEKLPERLSPVLLEKLKHCLTPLVGLSQHRGTGLTKDLVFGITDHLISHVGIPNAGFGGLQIFSPNIEAADRMLQTVLVGAKISTLLVNSLDRLVEGSNGTVGTVRT
jgi:hypothetical protein